MRKTLSVFVDESGNFGDLSDSARFCIVTFVIHDQALSIARLVDELDRSNEDLGLDPSVFQFHAAPLIRQENEYAAMSRKMRGRIFDRMLSFVRKAEFKFACFSADTNYLDRVEQVAERLSRSMRDFLLKHHNDLFRADEVDVYYDAGQKSVSRILREAFAAIVDCPVCFKQGVRQSDYKLFQVADFICTAKLIELRCEKNIPMNASELRFFGGPRDFKRNVLKKLKLKELS